MKYTVTVAPRANPRVKALRGKAKAKFAEAVCDEPDKAPIDQELADLINALRPPRRRRGR